MRYGDAIIATAPVGLVSLVLSAITPASPAAAASLTVGIAHKTMGGKLLALMSGASAGVILVLGSQYLGAKPAIDEEKEGFKHRALIRLRWLGMLWSSAMLVAFVCSYHFTVGWVWPLLAYSLFVIGLVIYTLRFWNVSSLTSRSNAVGRWTGMLLGASAGYMGLVAGLYQAGRLM